MADKQIENGRALSDEVGNEIRDVEIRGKERRSRPRVIRPDGTTVLVARQNNAHQCAYGRGWAAYHADCVEFTSEMPEASVDLSIYSLPFANLYVYSDDPRDMGNCADDDEFMEQYGFLVPHMLRVTKPGRMSCVHCIDLPSFKWKHGEVGLRDFPGMIIKAHIDAGWIYHSRVTIWKDPVTEMQRTKSIGLLHKQLKKDSTMSRQGLPDYLLIFRAPGENDNPVSHTAAEFPVEQWQEWASPVWMSIRQSVTLNREAARESADEKHICPLQLDVIERCLTLWSNQGDVVFSPFMGIGSEGYQALKQKRRFIGTELKGSYFTQACGFLRQAEAEQETLL